MERLRQIVVDDPHEALVWEVDKLLRRGPDAHKPLVLILQNKKGVSREYAYDIDYEITDDQGRPITIQVTHEWEGFVLPSLASEPDVQNSRVTRNDVASSDGDRTA